jgi:hypothetical protein
LDEGGRDGNDEVEDQAKEGEAARLKVGGGGGGGCGSGLGHGAPQGERIWQGTARDEKRERRTPRTARIDNHEKHEAHEKKGSKKRNLKKEQKTQKERNIEHERGGGRAAPMKSIIRQVGEKVNSSSGTTRHVADNKIT